MSVGFIDIDIVGGKRDVQDMLEHLDSALSPLGMQIFLNGRIGPFLRKRAADRFKNEGDDAVGRWRQLSTVTNEWREFYGFPPAHPINRRTGALEAYITGAASDVKSGPGWSMLTYPDTPPGSKWTAEKLRTAQRGKEYPNTTSRPVLGMGEVDLSFTLTQLALHIQGWDRSIS